MLIYQRSEIWLKNQGFGIRGGAFRTPALIYFSCAAPQIMAKRPPKPQENITTQVIEQDELFYCISVHSGDNLIFFIHSFTWWLPAFPVVETDSVAAINTAFRALLKCWSDPATWKETEYYCYSILQCFPFFTDDCTHQWWLPSHQYSMQIWVHGLWRKGNQMSCWLHSLVLIYKAQTC